MCLPGLERHQCPLDAFSPCFPSQQNWFCALPFIPLLSSCTMAPSTLGDAHHSLLWNLQLPSNPLCRRSLQWSLALCSRHYKPTQRISFNLYICYCHWALFSFPLFTVTTPGIFLPLRRASPAPSACSCRNPSGFVWNRKTQLLSKTPLWGTKVIKASEHLSFLVWSMKLWKQLHSPLFKVTMLPSALVNPWLLFHVSSSTAVQPFLDGDCFSQYQAMSSIPFASVSF